MATENTALMTRPNSVIGVNMKELQDAAGLIYESKVFNDLQSKEAAAIKIIAGSEYGFTPFQSMSMFDFIQGRPTLNAHGKATLINSSGDFRLRIKTLTAEECVIDVLRKDDSGEWKVINTNSFTIADAQKAELTNGKNAHSWKKYPRNMLFARCVSNIWRWDCAELNTRRLTPGHVAEFSAPELEEDAGDETPAEPPYIDAESIAPVEAEDASGEIVDAEVTPIDDAEELRKSIGQHLALKVGETLAEQKEYLRGRDPRVMPLNALQRLHDDLAAM